MIIKNVRKLFKKLNIRRRIRTTERSAPISALKLFGVILGALLSFHAVSTIITTWYDSNVGWRQVEQTKIDKLAPLQSLDYINSVLGTAELRLAGAEGLTKYIYQERGYWVAAYANEESSVEHLIFTSCSDEGFYPVISKNPVGPPVTLGKTSMKDVLDDSSSGSGLAFEPHYFLRGATAPTYFIDETYYGNPSTYQTAYSGIVEYCGVPKLPEEIWNILNHAPVISETTWAGMTKQQIDTFRSSIVVNTFGMSAPSAKSLYEPGSGIDLSVSYVNAGILERCSLTKPEYDKRIKELKSIQDQSVKDYEVYRYEFSSCK